MTATSRHFDADAPGYDEATAGGNWTPNNYLRDALQRLPLQPRTGLDLGCGTGQSIATVLNTFPDIAMTGVDVSPEMAKHAVAKFGSGVDIQCRDLAAWLAESTEKYDLISAIGCLEFVNNLPSVLSDVLEHLDAEGHLIFTFEPLITGLAGHTERQSPPVGSAFAEAEVTIFRWELGEVLDALTGLPGRLVQAREFTPYARPSGAAVYHLMHYARSAAPGLASHPS